LANNALHNSGRLGTHDAQIDSCGVSLLDGSDGIQCDRRNHQHVRHEQPAFLGNQFSAIGLSLTFDELIVNTFAQPALNPQGPLVAITNGTLTLVFGGGGAAPPIST
jgi:hypothetical protein